MFLSLKKSLIGLIVVALLSSTHSFSAMALSLDTIVNANEKIYSEKNKNNHTKYYDFLLNESKQFLMNDEENSVNATTTFDDTKNNNTDKANDSSNINNTDNKENSNLTNTENNNQTTASNDTTSNENLSPENANQDDTENNEEPEEDEADNKKENEDDKIENKSSNTENNNDTNNESNNENNNNTNENNNKNTENDDTKNTENDKVDTENTEQEKVEVVVDDDVIEDDKTDSIVSDTPVLNDAVDNLNDNNTVNKEAAEVDVATDSDIDVEDNIGDLFGTASGEIVSGKDLKIGDYVTFGTYEQDAVTDNGKEDLEWIVVDIDEKTNEAILVTRYLIDHINYHTDDDWVVTYENSYIRKFLNNDFYTNTFNTNEKKYIKNKINLCGTNTQDKAWLLSSEEAFRYFKEERNYYYEKYEGNELGKICYCPKAAYTKYAKYKMDLDGFDTYDMFQDEYSFFIRGEGWQNKEPQNHGFAEYLAVRTNTRRDLDSDSFATYLGYNGSLLRPAISIDLSITNINRTRDVRQINIGDYVTLGKYEQDNVSANGKEDIEWLVTEVNRETDEATLLAVYTLEYIPYSGQSYKDSNIRSFLNGDFYDTAFNDKEKGIIKIKHNKEEVDDYNRAIVKYPTDDKVWLLGESEYRGYTDTLSATFVPNIFYHYFTYYAQAKKGSNSGAGYFLRSDYVDFYRGISGVDLFGYSSLITYHPANKAGIRPAILVELSALEDGSLNNDRADNATEYPIHFDLAEGSFKDEYKDVYENAKHNDQEDYILPTKDKLVAPYNKVFKEWTIDGIATTSISKDIHKEVTVVANWTRSVGNFESYSIGKYKVSSLDTEDEQDLEWIVLDKSNGKLLLTTKNIIDTKTYDKNGNAEFKNSTIKTWLNNDFYNQVFDNNQKENIVKEENNEKVFLLTKEQANEYFGNNVQRVARATDHSQHVDNDGETLDATNDIACYWLTSDTNNGKAPYVSKMGEVIEDGIDVKTKTIGVRPCIWVMENKIADIRMKPLQKILNAIGNQWNSFIGFMNKLWIHE